MNKLYFFFLLVSLSVCSVHFAHASEQVQNVVINYLEEKTAITGKFDFFDEELDKVRNLDMLKVQGGAEETDAGSVVKADFRDINTGEVVIVAFTVQSDSVVSTKIQKIFDPNAKKKEELKNKEYSDQEIQDFMLEYLKKKAKFTGTFDIYDPEESKLRKLEPGEFDEKVRRFGVLFISSVQCLDLDTQQTIKLDVTVKSTDGVLNVDSVRIVSKK